MSYDEKLFLKILELEATLELTRKQLWESQEFLKKAILLFEQNNQIELDWYIDVKKYMGNTNI